MRGHEVTDTGQPIEVPVGEGTLGRIMNGIGEPIDEAGPIKSEGRRAIHQQAPSYTDQSTEAEILVTGIKVVDLPRPLVRQGRQDRPVRRRRRRQDRADPGADQQRRQGARRVIRCSPASASGPAKGNDLYHEFIESKVNNGSCTRRIRA